MSHSNDKSGHSATDTGRYRPDIDGMRAIAVMLVVVFHAFPELGGGGFIGVDVFFVISGFLISGIILDELNRGKFSFKGFYARRIKRIYPSLLLVLTACYIFGWFVLLPEEFAGLAKHSAGGAGFVANFVLWRESGYFDVQTELKPMLHLWSLGVEEQFYVVWPLLLFLAYRSRLNLYWLLACLLALSLIWNVTGVVRDPVGTFYLPHTRFWELIAGALLAYRYHAEFRLQRQSPNLLKFRRLSEAAACLGLTLLVIAVAAIDSNSAFPGWWALLPTLGSVLIIGAGRTAWINQRLLAHPVLVWIGLISYPLYLWHWPLLAFSRILNLGAASVTMRALLVLTGVGLAWFTYRFVERPLRFGGGKVNKTMLLSTLMVLVFVLNYGTFLADGLPLRMQDKAEYAQFFSNYHYTESHDLLRYDRHECNFYDITNNVAKTAIDPSCVTPHSDLVVFVWGDSHAQHLNYGLKAVLPKDVSLLQAGASGCPPSAVELSPDPLQSCNRANEFVWRQLSALKPRVVILAQQRGHQVARLDAVIARLKQLRIEHVIVLGPVPQWHPFLYQIILRKYWRKTDNRLAEYLDKNVMETDRLLKARYEHADAVSYVSIIDGLCNRQGCLTHLGNDRKEGLITYDYGHFTLPASEYVARTILLPAINAGLRR